MDAYPQDACTCDAHIIRLSKVEHGYEIRIFALERTIVLGFFSESHALAIFEHLQRATVVRFEP